MVWTSRGVGSLGRERLACVAEDTDEHDPVDAGGRSSRYSCRGFGRDQASVTQYTANGWMALIIDALHVLVHRVMGRGGRGAGLGREQWKRRVDGRFEAVSPSTGRLSPACMQAAVTSAMDGDRRGDGPQNRPCRIPAAPRRRGR